MGKHFEQRYFYRTKEVDVELEDYLTDNWRMKEGEFLNEEGKQGGQLCAVIEVDGLNTRLSEEGLLDFEIEERKEKTSKRFKYYFKYEIYNAP